MPTASAERARVDALEPPATSKHDERRTDELQTGQNEEEADRGTELIESVFHSPGSPLQPNGSRLSCGANAGGRKRRALRYKVVGAQTPRFL